MRVLVLNSGSSSVKFRVIDVAIPTSRSLGAAQAVMGGAVTGIGGRATLHVRVEGQPPSSSTRPVPDHARAVQWVFERFGSTNVEAVGHRIVHGGSRFSQSVPIDDEVLAEIERLGELAPLHNPACLAGIRGAQACLGPNVPMVAVFDTAFHHELPRHAATYGIPEELAVRHAIRRYGFHGIAHASLAAGYAASTGRPAEGSRLITLHLGNGCSATAIRDGRSVDTSMGFTPLEGLLMGTRSGDLDPAVVTYLAQREGVSAETVVGWLNDRSGLLGVSGISHDMQRLLQAAERERDPHADRAIALFCYRVRKYIGAYLAVLGGADAVIFGGGIGERAPSIRAAICRGMEWCGLAVDPVRNAAAVDLAPGACARISPDGVGLAVFVAAADEETQIARETARCVDGPR